MSRYRITIDVEINDTAIPDPAGLQENAWEAVLKEAQCSHLRWGLDWMTSRKKDLNPAAAEHAIAYHKTWADILDKADFKLEKI